MKRVVLIIILTIFSNQAYGTVFTVPQDYPDIQAGIDACQNSDTVLIAPGTYTGLGNKNLDFNGKNIHVMSQSGPETTVIDCEGSGRGFFLHRQETPDALIQGLTIQNGHTPEGDGGGICCDNASPAIRDCHIKNNMCCSYRDPSQPIFNPYSVQEGGGIYLKNGTEPVSIIDCIISENTAWGIGGGLAVNNTQTVIQNCRFERNWAFNSGGGIARMHCESDMEIADCLFSGNFASSDGGAICLNNSGSFNLIRSTFSENRALRIGGAITFRRPPNDAIIIGGSAGNGNVFQNNIAGVGADLFSVESTPPINAQYNTFSGNFESEYYVTHASAFNFTHCISLMEPITHDVYVSPDGNNDNDGTSWPTAFKTIHHATSRISGDLANSITVHLAPGVYSPSSTGEIFPIPLTSYVSFVGDSMSTVIINAEQTAGVFMGISRLEGSLLNLTVCGGVESGGIYLENSHFTMTDCTITENTNWGDANGGGLCNFGSSIILNNCLIHQNTSINGGGIYAGWNSFSRFNHCTISNNSAYFMGGGYYGDGEVNPTFQACTFSGNSATECGGAILINWYGSHPMVGGSPEAGNYFTGNIAAGGADICIYDRPLEEQCDARYNTFSGTFLSDYYVEDQNSLNLDFCVSGAVPITQDVYVSTTGSNENDGLSQQTPFRSIHYALSRILATEFIPIVIHIEDGTYSPALTGEIFPVPVLDHISLEGSSAVCTILDAENEGNSTCIYSYNDRDSKISRLTLTHGKMNGPFGGALTLHHSDLDIHDCIISENESVFSAIMMDRSSARFINCLITDNSGIVGGGVYCLHEMFSDFVNCTITGNQAASAGGINGIGSGLITVKNSIVWNNTPPQINAELPFYAVDVTYSDIQDNHNTGEGVIDLDPLFCPGPLGSVYLSHTACGQWEDSPCMNSGDDLSSSICYNLSEGDICMSDLTTRSDIQEDAEIVDMGFHYPALLVVTCLPSATPTATPTRTPTPTVTPQPSTATPTAPATSTPAVELGVDLVISSTEFKTGDDFLLQAVITNTGPDVLNDIPLIILLDVFGSYWWYPTWDTTFMFEYRDIYFGETDIEIFHFTWPEVKSSASGILMYGALLNTAFTEILGNWDYVEFGWRSSSNAKLPFRYCFDDSQNSMTQSY